MAGSSIAENSASDDAPERLTARSAAPSAYSISVKNGRTTARKPSASYAWRTGSTLPPVKWMNWRPGTALAKRGNDSISAWLIDCAPWLPPITSNTAWFSSKPSTVRASAFSIGSIAERTGRPVARISVLSTLGIAAGNWTNTSSANGASSFTARPGMAFASCRKMRAPISLPAITGGALVNPPIASTASGRFSRNSFRHWPSDDQKLAANRGKLRLRPTTGSDSTSIP